MTPIIKRISTSSFVLASGGWCLLALCFFYWWIDLRNHKKYVQFFIVVGMNSLFIYLFIEIVGGRWFNGYITALSNGLMSIIHVPLGFDGDCYFTGDFFPGVGDMLVPLSKGNIL